MEKAVFYKIEYGLYLVGSVKEGAVNAQVANTVFQVSSKPPTIAISINRENLTHEYIKDSGVFSVCILSKHTPLSFIGTFGFHSGRDKNKFEGIDYKKGITGAPIILENIIAFLEAEVIGEIEVSTHTIFVGEVKEAKILTEEEPLTYSYYHKLKKGKVPVKAPLPRI